MKITSKEANKLLKKLNEDYNQLLLEESEISTFVASVTENVEDCRPKYNYEETQKKIKDYEIKIRKLKHAINIFNTTTNVEGFDMNIDEVLVWLPQLTKQKEKLASLRKNKERTRVKDRYGSYTERIDYIYINYDIEKVKKDYDEVANALNSLQIALDKANGQGRVEIDFEI